MKKLKVEDLGEIACCMYDSIVDDGLSDTTFVGYYEDAVCIIKNLLMFDDVIPYNIELNPFEINGYDKEYYVSLDSDLNIWCIKAYHSEHSCYLYDETKRLFIADDCNSAILNEIGCDEDNMYEVSYDLGNEESEYECDGNCACCKFAEKDDSDDKHEVVTRVAVDNDGVIRGFEKTWETKEGNMTYHSTYTHYSNNTELLKQLMENFDINF